MALLLKDTISENTVLGLWEIQEDYNTLYNNLILKQTDINTVNAFKNHARKLEWLSVRKLLKEITGTDEGIIYNEFRKPYLEHNSRQISITHSKNFTALLLSHNLRVGIDLEFMSHRISSIAHKFINDGEFITNDDNLRKYHLYIHWCAKEALYKICDKQNINFKTNLFVEPFTPQEKGTIKAWVKNPDIDENFELTYFRMGNYIIVYTTKE